MDKFELLTIEEAIKQGYEDTDYWMEDDEAKYTLCLVDTVDKKSLGTDGGEPEDQTFGRDWNWVVGAMNAAYAKGFREGVEKADALAKAAMDLIVSWKLTRKSFYAEEEKLIDAYRALLPASEGGSDE